MRWYPVYDIWLISEAGQVWSKKSNRLLKIRHRKDGYLDVKLSYRRFLVHRLVAIAFIPNPLNLLQVNHLDGNRGNPRLENLEWCEQRSNMQHAIKIGLFPNREGSKNGRATINEATALKIKQLLTSGLKSTNIAVKLRVNYNVVSNIKRGLTWKHVKILKDEYGIKPIKLEVECV